MIQLVDTAPNYTGCTAAYIVYHYRLVGKNIIILRRHGASLRGIGILEMRKRNVAQAEYGTSETRRACRAPEMYLVSVTDA